MIFEFTTEMLVMDKTHFAYIYLKYRELNLWNLVIQL